jgi:hypothetical protein
MKLGHIRRGSTMIGIKGVARTAVVGLIALISLLLTIDCAAAQPVPSAGRLETGAERAEPMADMCVEGRHGGRHSVPCEASPALIPVSRSGTGSASADVDGADDDRASRATTAPGAARPVVPLSRSGQLPVVLQVFRC